MFIPCTVSFRNISCLHNLHWLKNYGRRIALARKTACKTWPLCPKINIYFFPFYKILRARFIYIDDHIVLFRYTNVRNTVVILMAN